MFRERLTLRNLPRRMAPWQLTPEERYVERARCFFQGAPLALATAAAWLPAWLFLAQSHHSHAVVATILVMLLLGMAAAIGVAKLLRCAVGHAFDYLTAVSFGVLLVFTVVLIYSGVFLYLLYWG